MTQQQGTIKFFNEGKGFGFVKPDDGSAELFIHKTSLLTRVRENDRVTFEVRTGVKGPNAINVRVV